MLEEFKVSSKEEVCEIYFNGLTKPKFLYEFDEITPNGNHITGYINQKPNRYLGSMIILTVNNEPVEQFIQSMPKIHYFNNEEDICEGKYSDGFPCYEKLDGSCLILYPLKDHNGDTIEIVPKTRGRAVADEHFIELYKKIDTKNIIDYYKQHDGILIFEMYGILNQHDIIHYDTGIDIRLIGIYENGIFTNHPIIAEQYNFQLPDKVFTLYNVADSWYLKWSSKKYYNYMPQEFREEDKYYDTVEEAILGIKHELEELNKKYEKYNNRIATEGVVINTYRKDGSKKWLKCKPRSIEVKHKTINGIPVRSIKKECYKYFDEYGSDVAEIYKENPNHYKEYLKRMLSEEYNEDIINRSSNKIEMTFMQVWESKEVPTSIHNICQELFDKYKNEGISHCMRMFAEEYPMKKKKDARLVYSVLEKLFLKNEVEL